MQNLLLELTEAVIAIPQDDDDQIARESCISRIQNLLYPIIQACFFDPLLSRHMNADTLSLCTSSLKLLQCVILKLPLVFFKSLNSQSGCFGNWVTVRLLCTLKDPLYSTVHNAIIQNLALLLTANRPHTLKESFDLKWAFGVYCSALSLADAKPGASANSKNELFVQLNITSQCDVLWFVTNLNSLMHLIVLQGIPCVRDVEIEVSWRTLWPLFLLSLEPESESNGTLITKMIDNALDFELRLLDFKHLSSSGYELSFQAYLKCLFAVNASDNSKVATFVCEKFGCWKRQIAPVTVFSRLPGSAQYFKHVCRNAELYKQWPAIVQSSFLELLPSLYINWSNTSQTFFEYLGVLATQCDCFRPIYRCLSQLSLDGFAVEPIASFDIFDLNFRLAYLLFATEKRLISVSFDVIFANTLINVAALYKIADFYVFLQTLLSDMLDLSQITAYITHRVFADTFKDRVDRSCLDALVLIFAAPYFCNSAAVDLDLIWTEFSSSCKFSFGTVPRDSFFELLTPFVPLLSNAQSSSDYKLLLITDRNCALTLKSLYFLIFGGSIEACFQARASSVSENSSSSSFKFDFAASSRDLADDKPVQLSLSEFQADILCYFLEKAAPFLGYASAQTQTMLIELVSAAYKSQRQQCRHSAKAILASNKLSNESTAQLLLKLVPCSESDYRDFVELVLSGLEKEWLPSDRDAYFRFLGLLLTAQLAQSLHSATDLSVSLVETCFLKLSAENSCAAHEALLVISDKSCIPLKNLIKGFSDSFCQLVLRQRLYADLLPVLDVSFSELCSWQTSAAVYVAVLDNDYELLSLIAAAVDKEPSVLLVEEMAFVLSELFTQEQIDVSAALQKCLQLIEVAVCRERQSFPETARLSQTTNSSHSLSTGSIGRLSLSDVIRYCHMRLVTYLALSFGHCDSEKRHRAFLGLKLVHQMLVPEMKAASKQRKDSESDHHSGVSELLDDNLLALIAKINEIIAKSGTNGYENSVFAISSARAVLCLKYVFQQKPEHLHLVFNQLLATLQTALSSTCKNVVDSSLEAWGALIIVAPWPSIERNIELIVCTLAHYHGTLAPEQQRVVNSIFEVLFANTKPQGMAKRVLEPNVVDKVKFLIEAELLPVYSVIKSFLGGSDVIYIDDDGEQQPALLEKIQRFVETLGHEHAIVLEFALAQLCAFLSAEKIQLAKLLLAEAVPLPICSLMEKLLILCRAHISNKPLATYCCQCLGLIGAVDPARVALSLQPKSHFFLADFSEPSERLDYSFHVISTTLVPAFRRAHTSRLQSHISYAIQELLKACGVTPEALASANKENAAEARDCPRRKQLDYKYELYCQWQKLSASTVETITPLLTSKYSLQSTFKVTEKAPLYPLTGSFKEWLQSFAYDLVLRLDDAHHGKNMFTALRSVVMCDDLAISQYLLPHLFLVNLLSRGSAKVQDTHDRLLLEVNCVLNALVGDHDPYAAADSFDGLSNAKAQLASHLIYSILDFIARNMRSSDRDMRDAQQQSVVWQNTVISEFLSKVSQELLAKASMCLQAYARALMHLEQHMRSIKAKCADCNARISDSLLELSLQGRAELRPYFQQLLRVFALMDEPDCIAGVMAMVVSPSLQEQVLEFETVGDWASAQSCYELALRQAPETFSLQTGLMTSLRQLGHYESMLAHSKALSLTCKDPIWRKSLNSFAIEASWRLGKWSEASECLQNAFVDRFEVNVGQMLLLSDRRHELEPLVERLQLQMALKLSSASVESYHRCYSVILQLHMLQELLDSSNGRYTRATGEWWDLRLEALQQTVKVTEPVLSLRRALVQKQLSVDKSQVGYIYLQSAKLSRKAGYFQNSLNSILHCKQLLETMQVGSNDGEFSLALVHLERGKWYWCQGQTHKALSELQAALSAPVESVGGSELMAKIELLLTRWTEATSISHSNAILEKYGKLCEQMPHWEKCFYFVGRYYDKLFENERLKDVSVGCEATSSGSDSSGNLSQGSSPSLLMHRQARLAQYIYRICKNYGKALENGSKYVYQSLPRLLTLWLDFETIVFVSTGSLLSASSDKSSKTRKSTNSAQRDDKALKILQQLNKLMRKWSESFPKMLFLQAFPQLISRIGHKSETIFPVLEQILVNTVCQYPQQTLWQMMSLYKSMHAVRKSRCVDIFQASIQRYSKLKSLIDQFTQVSDNLVRLASCSTGQRQSSLSLHTDFAPLKRMAPLDIILPIQEAFHARDGDAPTIAYFHDYVELMRSMQQPRKVKVDGSDGRTYVFLCKSRDDLRKDNRLMECNSMLNKLLKRDAEGRRRRLAIRTYAVVPLNEECGLIEWVNNMVGFRHIILKLYERLKLGMSFNEIHALYQQKGLDPHDRFVNILLPQHPAVFHQWFLEQFPEPTRWFASRNAYASTLAVMSMVGYVLGLGDRHGENILFDQTCGDVLHVDFNCLFEKGLTLTHPEKVPFRLTHNMIDALGVTGVEGVFRTACQTTLALLRANKDSILSLLETFIHDPLVEWGKTSYRSSGNQIKIEAMNNQARKHLVVIDKKLQGVLNPGLPLSVPGQVHELIQQATNVGNLSVMFIGWGAYH